MQLYEKKILSGIFMFDAQFFYKVKYKVACFIINIYSTYFIYYMFKVSD